MYENFEIENFRKSWIRIKNFRKSKNRKVLKILIFLKISIQIQLFRKISISRISDIFQTIFKSISKNFYRSDFQNFGTWRKLRLTSTKTIQSAFSVYLLEKKLSLGKKILLLIGTSGNDVANSGELRRSRSESVKVETCMYICTF